MSDTASVISTEGDEFDDISGDEYDNYDEHSEHSEHDSHVASDDEDGDGVASEYLSEDNTSRYGDSGISEGDTSDVESDVESDMGSRTPVKKRATTKRKKVVEQPIHPWITHLKGWTVRLDTLDIEVDTTEGIDIIGNLNTVLSRSMNIEPAELDEFHRNIQLGWNEFITKSSQKLQVEDSDEICPKCKSAKTLSSFLQTRSADEPTSVFINCVECRHRWRVA